MSSDEDLKADATIGARIDAILAKRERKPCEEYEPVSRNLSYCTCGWEEEDHWEEPFVGELKR